MSNDTNQEDYDRFMSNDTNQEDLAKKLNDSGRRVGTRRQGRTREQTKINLQMLPPALAKARPETKWSYH